MKKENATLYTFVAALFIAAMDTGIVSPTRGQIGHYFNIDLPTSIWIMSIYSLGFSTSLLLMSLLSQKYGIKKIMFIAVSLFTISSLLCGIAPNFSTFIGLRFTQGFFAGGIFPLATSYIGSEFSQNQKGYAMGVLGGTFALGNVLGPSVGSLILYFVGNANWSYLFYINIVFGSLALVLISKNVVEVIYNPQIQLELISIVFASLFVFCVMLFFTFLDVTKITHILTEKKLLYSLVGALISLAISWYFTYKNKGPLLIIRTLFKNSYMLKTIISAFFGSVSIFAIVLYLPQISEYILHLPIGQGGYLAAIVGISGTFMGPISGKWLNKFGAYKIYVMFTTCLTFSLCFLLLSIIYQNVFLFVISLILIGFSQNTVIIICSNYFVASTFKPKLQSSAQSILILFRSNYWAIVPSLAIAVLKPFNEIASKALKIANAKMSTKNLNLDVCLHINNLIAKACSHYQNQMKFGYVTLVSICLIVSVVTLISTRWFKNLK